MGSLPLALRWSLLGSLRQQAAARHAALCRCGRCAGPRRWSFSAGARAGLAAPSASVEGAPWGPSRDYFPDEIADERVADGVDEWRRCVAELELKSKKSKKVGGGRF